MRKQKTKNATSTGAFKIAKVVSRPSKVQVKEAPAFQLDAGDPLKIVLKALENKKYAYRTISGIVKETNLPKETVCKVLMSNDKKIRRSLLKAPDGSNLYASRKMVSVVEDFLSTIKAINSAKFGG